jgi:hypothetical protein
VRCNKFRSGFTYARYMVVMTCHLVVKLIGENAGGSGIFPGQLDLQCGWTSVLLSKGSSEPHLRFPHHQEQVIPVLEKIV